MSEVHVPGESVKGHLVIRLVANKVLTQFQAEWFESIGAEIDEGVFAHTYLRSVPEHARAILERGAS